MIASLYYYRGSLALSVLLNEILPNDRLLPRAWEIAERIMEQPRAVRHLTHQLVVRPWKRLLTDDYQINIKSEMYG